MSLRIQWRHRRSQNIQSTMVWVTSLYLCLNALISNCFVNYWIFFKACLLTRYLISRIFPEQSSASLKPVCMAMQPEKGAYKTTRNRLLHSKTHRINKTTQERIETASAAADDDEFGKTQVLEKTVWTKRLPEWGTYSLLFICAFCGLVPILTLPHSGVYYWATC